LKFNLWAIRDLFTRFGYRMTKCNAPINRLLNKT